MKMKKTIFTIAIMLLTVAAQAQIKVHDDGQVSIGSLTKSCGVQVHPNGYTSFRTQSDTIWGWATLSYANNLLQKHWIVVNLDDPSPGAHTFFVTGNGYVYKQGSWSRPAGDIYGRIDEAGAILDQITGVWYVPDRSSVKNSIRPEEGRRPGVNPQEVMEVLPEAVTADETGLLYVDYEALTVFLIEAVKEQQKDIELLRKALEENGLMEPEEP